MLWLEKVFDYLGLVLINLFQLEDICCLFLTSRGFKAFLQHRLDGIAHCTKKTVGSQGSGFDGRLASYVRWMFPTVFFDENGWVSPVCFSCCLHAGMSGGNVFDLAKIASFKPLSEIKLSIGDGSSSSEFFSSLSGFNNRCQEKLRTKRVTVFQLMMDSRCDGFYYIYTIGRMFPNLAVLNLVDAENVSCVTKTESLLQAFGGFQNLRTLNISGNFDLGVDRYYIPLRSPFFHIYLINFSVANNNKINDKFFDILATSALNLKSVGIKDCSNVTAQCLSFLARCRMIEFVHVPSSFRGHILFEAYRIRFRNNCYFSSH